MMKRSVALFDFDNTLASGDTIHRLLKYDLKKHPLHVFYFINSAITFIAYKLKIKTYENLKETILFPLKHMNEEELKAFYKNYVTPYYYDNVVEVFNKHKQDGCIVIICTASNETYMKYCDLDADKVIGTRVENGKIIGKNCRKQEKIPRILEYLDSIGVEIDYESSYGYSDSNDDIPMLSLVKYKNRVLLKTGEIVEFKE